MASIVREIVIDVPAVNVWGAIRDFGNVHRLVPGLLADCHLDGDARVVTFRGGGRVARELLVSIDDDVRRLVYAEPDGPFISRNASCQVFPVDSRSSRFVWTQDLLPDELASVISSNMDKALPDMKRTLERIHAGSAYC
jgi:carbon monoxide dehydrogenase subunit G